MGSARRQQALTQYGESGVIVENARAARMRLRSEAAVVREDFALDLFAKGDTVAMIEAKLKAEFGVKYQREVPKLVKRALVRRAAAYADRVEEARALYVEQNMKLLHVWMPRALGELVDGDGNKIPPDPKAAMLVLQYMDRIAEVTGARQAPKAGDVNITNNVVLPPDNPDAVRAAVLTMIDREREKFGVLEGQFREGLAAVTGPPADALPPPEINFPLGPAPD